MFSLPHEPHDQVATPSSLWHLLDPDMKASQAARAEPQAGTQARNRILLSEGSETSLYCRDD